MGKRRWITSQRVLAMGPGFWSERKAERRAARIAEMQRLNAVESRACPYCSRRRTSCIAIHEQHEGRCLKRLWRRLNVERLKRREDLRKHVQGDSDSGCQCVGLCASPS